MKIKEKREALGMSRAEMSRVFKIPIRTLENWDSGKSSPAEWAEILILEKLERMKKEESEMKKYVLKKDSIEVKYKDRKEIAPGVVLSSDNQEPETIKLFDNKEDALKELQKYKSSIAKHTYNGTIYVVEEYYVEENTYDEDGEWLEGGDVWEFSQMEIELVEKPSFDTLAVFDNMKDAEKAEDDYEGDGEVFLSFC